MGVKTRLRYGILGMSLLWSVLIPVIYLAIAFNVWGLWGHPSVNDSFVFIYGGGSIMLALYTFFIAFPLDILNLRVNKLSNPRKTFGFFFINQSGKHRLLSRPYLRYVPMVLFAAVVGFGIFFGQGKIQAWPVPTPFGSGDIFAQGSVALSAGDRILHQTIEPSFVEDGMMLLANNILLALISLFFFVLYKLKIMKRFIDIKRGPLIFLFFVIFTSLFVSIGYGSAINGFASLHENVQGDDVVFTASAVLFSWLNQVIYQTTGLFWLPLAHLTNNLLFSFKLAIGLSIGGFGLGQILLATKKHKKNNEVFIWQKKLVH